MLSRTNKKTETAHEKAIEILEITGKPLTPEEYYRQFKKWNNHKYGSLIAFQNGLTHFKEITYSRKNRLYYLKKWSEYEQKFSTIATKPFSYQTIVQPSIDELEKNGKPMNARELFKLVCEKNGARVDNFYFWLRLLRETGKAAYSRYNRMVTLTKWTEVQSPLFKYKTINEKAIDILKTEERPLTPDELFGIFSAEAPGMTKTISLFKYNILRTDEIIYDKKDNTYSLNPNPASKLKNKRNNLYKNWTIAEIATEVLKKAQKPLTKTELFSLFEAQAPGMTRNIRTFQKALMHGKEIIYSKYNQSYSLKKWENSESALYKYNSIEEKALEILQALDKPITLQELFSIFNSEAPGIARSIRSFKKTLIESEEIAFDIITNSYYLRQKIYIEPPPANTSIHGTIAERAIIILKGQGRSMTRTELYEIFKAENPISTRNIWTFKKALNNEKEIIFYKWNNTYALKEWPGIEDFPSISKKALEILEKTGHPLTRDELFQMFNVQSPGKTKNFKTFQNAIYMEKEIVYNKWNGTYLLRRMREYQGDIRYSTIVKQTVKLLKKLGKGVNTQELFELFNAETYDMVKNILVFKTALQQSGQIIYNQYSGMYTLKSLAKAQNIHIRYKPIAQKCIEIMEKIGRPIPVKKLFEMYNAEVPGHVKNFATFQGCIRLKSKEIVYDRQNKMYFLKKWPEFLNTIPEYKTIATLSFEML